MHPPNPKGYPEAPPASTPGWPADPAVELHESRNLALLALHQIVFRIGWIFKTESVIIPAFLDLLAGPSSGMLRGLLPVMNRFGQSVPPALFAGWLRNRQLKKRALAGFVMAMSLPFAAMAVACFVVGVCQWTGVLWWFLGLYALFFVFNGLYHLAFGTVQGKLIRPWRRGRLLLISTFYGALPAMLMAWWLLPGWLRMPEAGFAWIFSFAAACFFLSGLTVLALFEPRDEANSQLPEARRANVSEIAHVLRHDGNLRRLTVVAMLFGSGLIVFPHYQALALGPMELPMEMLMLFAITQNASVGIFSLFLGPIADRWGNRAALFLVVLGSAIAPTLAVVLSQLPVGVGEGAYWLVYVPLGITPLALRILVNYTLEICVPHQHPCYLATVNLCLAVPFVFAPLVGFMIDMESIGFQVVFSVAAVLVALGAILTLTLEEPRSRWIDGELGAIGTGGEE
jgi:MFS family permease